MSGFNVVIDAREVIDAFNRAPRAMKKQLNDLIYDGAVDIQRAMRENAPIHDGQLRRSIKIQTRRRSFEAEVGSKLKYAKYVEEGTRPHWTSKKNLQKWADDKGIPVGAVQWSIAQRGTKGKWFSQKTYNFNHRKVKSHVVSGMVKFVQDMNNGAI